MAYEQRTPTTQGSWLRMFVLNYEAHHAGLNRGPNFQPWCGSCGHQSDCFYAGGTGCGPTTQWGDAWCEVNMLGTACNRD